MKKESLSPYSGEEIVKLIYDTKALNIWNRKTGPVFWYALGVPGPFYVNTELVLGAALAERLLEGITAIVAETKDLAVRAERLNALMGEAYDASPVYQRVIASMVAAAKAAFPAGAFTLVSGGERRDWLFSIPFAAAYGVPHVFLFKGQSFYGKEGFKPQESVLHVADLLNNAASFFDNWFPALEKAQLKCPATLCLNTRGSNGLTRLGAVGVKVLALNSIDRAFFEKSAAQGIIDNDTSAEIGVFFDSPKAWAEKYLLGDVGLFDVRNLDPKSFERLQSFFAKDPWGLRGNHGAFFAAMEKEIARRVGGAL